MELVKLLAEAKNPSSRSKKRGYLSSQPWFHPAVFFAAYTGCRRGEILAVRWSDVDLEGKTVTIARSLTERMAFKLPKNDRVRTLAMSEALCAALRSHKADQAKEKLFLGGTYKDSDLVFAHADGSPIDPWNFGSAVRDCIARSGVPSVTLHGLRDTHASLLAKAGVPLEVVSKRLGHSNIAITAERYLDVYSDRDVAAAIALDRLVS
jgi:integrase